jgi:RNA polymerase sigma-70 factor (sigma-E family)
VSWEGALTQLVEARGSALKRYAYLLCGDNAGAEDLVQDALLRAFTRPGPGDGEQLEQYVRKIVLNLFLDRLRRRRLWARLRPLVVSPAQTDDPIETVARSLDMRAALLALSPRQRACVVLRYHLDLPVAEIAETLGSSPGAVKRHLHDARTRLTELLEADDREVEENAST